MQSKQLEIINPLGLHARAAAKLVQLSAGFASQITISKDDKSANAKSIMKVMMLAASRGSLVTLEIDGTGNTTGTIGASGTEINIAGGGADTTGQPRCTSCGRAAAAPAASSKPRSEASGPCRREIVG